MITELPIELIEAIDRIVNYNWTDEFNDYDKHGGGEAHIFTDLQRVNNWLVEISKEKEKEKDVPSSRVQNLMCLTGWRREKAEAHVNRYPLGESK